MSTCSKCDGHDWQVGDLLDRLSNGENIWPAVGYAPGMHMLARALHSLRKERDDLLAKLMGELYVKGHDEDKCKCGHNYIGHFEQGERWYPTKCEACDCDEFRRNP